MLAQFHIFKCKMTCTEETVNCSGFLTFLEKKYEIERKSSTIRAKNWKPVLRYL